MSSECGAHAKDRLEAGLESGSIIRKGCYLRLSDRARVPRYFCKVCGKHLSVATASPCYGQHKRQFNLMVFFVYNSLVSQRRTAELLRLNKKTVARKLVFLGKELKNRNDRLLDRILKSRGPIVRIQFDEIETSEHSKCKPLSIPVVVTPERLILGFEVAVMPAKGHLAAISRKKYGPRPDERGAAIRRLFERVRPRLSSSVEVLSDECPRYPSIVAELLPSAKHRTFKGRRGCVAGQGELKKIGHDPLFALNHTAAMFRANVNRLIRRTWCTTKKRERLADHLTLYMAYHNLKICNELDGLAA